MKKSKYFKEKVKAIEVRKKTISQLLDEMADTGFQGRKLAEIVKVWEKMIKDKGLTILMGYAGSLSTTGQWKIINWLIEKRFVDILVATGANLSEDIVEAMGYSYWKGSHLVDDAELLKTDLNRYYDVFGSEIDYMGMTELIAKFIIENLKENYPYSSREFLYLFGNWLNKKRINSIAAIAAKNKIPVFCPAIVDSPYGDAGLIAKSKGFDLILDNMKDYIEFMSLGKKIKNSGVIYIGGGVPKDFIQLLAVTSNLLYPERRIPGRKPEIFRAKRGKKQELIETYYPHKYAIQITTDSPQWGGLCFSKFSRIMVVNKKIKFAKDIEVGDKLLTTDDKGDLAETEVKKVLKRKINKREHICVIKVEDNRIKCGGGGVTEGEASGHKVKLIATENHLVFTQRGWVKAKDLTLKDKILKITQYDKISFERKNKIPSHLKNYLFPSGEKNPLFGKTGAQNPFFGKVHSEETKEYISSLRKGKTWEELIGEERAEELKQRYRETMRGERNPSWAGGTSWEPYNKEFWEVRRKVLERDSYKCKICGITEKKNLEKCNQYLSIHHIDYNKKNSGLGNLITLCSSCHGKTVFPKYRKIWNKKLVTTVDDKDCPGFLPIKEIIAYKKRRQIVGCLHGDEVYDFICEPHHKFFADWILIHNSGCTFEEATSWGKESITAPKVQCYCDATIALPIVSHALYERIKSKRKGTDFSFLFEQ